MNSRTTALPLMMGVPDNKLVGVSATSSGEIRYNFLDNSRIATNLAPEFKQRMLRVFFGRDIPIRMPPALRRSPMLNAIGDPDISANALRCRALCRSDPATNSELSKIIADRHSGASRDPLCLSRDNKRRWIPACAGMTMPTTSCPQSLTAACAVPVRNVTSVRMRVGLAREGRQR